MAIGIDFVKKIDRNWEKHIKKHKIENIAFSNEKFRDDVNKINKKNNEINSQILDYEQNLWDYWKKRYYFK
jgi:hypothetical protein